MSRTPVRPSDPSASSACDAELAGTPHVRALSLPPAPPPPQRMVLAWMVQRYLAFAVKCGMSPEALCEAAGITEAQLAVADVYVPYQWLWVIRDEIIKRRPHACVGLELGQFLSPDQYGHMGQALKHVETPRAAIQLWNRLILIVHRGPEDEPRLREVDGIAHWEMPHLPEEPPESFQSLFVGAIRSFRALTGQPIAPREVHFERCPPRHVAPLSAFFGAQVRLDQPRTALVFDSKVLDTPMLQADRTAVASFRAQFEKQASTNVDPLCSAVQSAIEAELLAGRLCQARVAKLFGMTTRTLQRKCRERGIRYQQLVMRARRATAMRLLENRSLNIHEVAVAVGYDASSFNRVFRTWTGMSPSAFRKASAASPAFG